MSKIFISLAVVFSLMGAFLWSKNGTALEKNKQDTENAEQKYAQLQKTFTQSVAELNGLNDDIKQAEADIEESQAKLAEVSKQREEIKSKVASIESKHDDLVAALERAKEDSADLPKPDVIIPQIKELKARSLQVATDLADAESQLANLNQQKARTDVELANFNEKLAATRSGKSFPNLKTRVSAVYRNWGFVLLSAGDKQGVVTGSILDVVRDEEVVAKLQVTAVEANKASANIVRESVAEGVNLHPGDVVIAEQTISASEVAVIK
ncbi:hypothetical protein [Persicirhabdus sediminis]|uniref:Uncharacterized protein n=1 Tax=Persicirhabdus sediminis TaxID=454144 RepID=A0A8J7MF96_9BACT|nr:hypothetical protein [Persicirhabdus sediminis]MBK1791641.1 hypothetical protein [Persicirhabdus sediminis]